MTPRQTRRSILKTLQAGNVPFVSSSPGMGKSALNKSIAKDENLFLIDHRLSTSAPEDLSGLPRFNPNGTAEFVPFNIFPTEETPLPPGCDGWLLFLDEFNSAHKSVQAAAYKLILDKQVGQHKLHERVLISCAGNLATDRAITNDLSTAMQSRVIHMEMEVNNQEWMEDVAIANNYDERIKAFIAYSPSSLMDFKPDHNEKTFCCPRTWEFMNNFMNITSVDDMEQDTALYAGTITSGVAAAFVAFSQFFKNLVNIDYVKGNPNSAPVPQDRALAFAQIIHLTEYVDANSFDAVSTYANRFPVELRILYFRTIVVKKPNLRQHPTFITAMGELSRYLNGQTI